MAEGTDEHCIAGNEPVYDFYCEICRESGQYLEAEGFCVDCGDYLCSTCVKYHTRSRLTINHDVLDKHNMPKDKPLAYNKCSRVIETKCKTHRGKTVEYYCKKHDYLGCGTCFIMSHSTCKSKFFIPEVPENFEKSQEFQSFVEHLTTISKRSSAVIQLSRDNATRAEHCCKHTANEIRHFREEINKRLDDLENNLIKQVEGMKKENVEAMKSISNKAMVISGDLEQITSKIKGLQNDRKICQLYISMKECSTEIKRMESTLVETENDCVRLYDFEPSSKLTEICKDVDAFGHIHFREKGRVSQGDVIMDPKNTTALLMSDIDLTSDIKSPYCQLVGSTVLTKDQMIVTDWLHYTVSLLDTKKHDLIYDMQFSSKPWDVCAICKTQIAITVPDENEILVLQVTDRLSLERKITVNGQCRGIAYSRNRLVVTFENPPKLEIIDLHGNVVKRIENDRSRGIMFHWPWYVCLSTDEETIYISDTKANKVLRLTFNGEFLSEYTDSELKSPYKVCADERGNIYVASEITKSVHMITPDCSKIKILLTQADGLTNNVYSVSHCHETNRLFVGMQHYSKIKVFQLQ